MIGPNGCVAPNRVWFLGSCVLNRVYNFTIQCLEQVSFWTGSLELCERCVWVRTLAVSGLRCDTNIFYNLKTSSERFPARAMLLHSNNQGHKKMASCLKQGCEMNGFCLEWGQGLKALVAHLHLNFPKRLTV